MHLSVCVCVYLVYGFEERPVQVCESSCHIPGVDPQESHRPPAELSAVCQRRLEMHGGDLNTQNVHAEHCLQKYNQQQSDWRITKKEKCLSKTTEQQQ